MAKLRVKKKRAIRLLNYKMSEGRIIADKISSIKNKKEYLSVIDLHENWWNSIGEILRQVFDDDRIANKFQYVGVFAPKVKSLREEIIEFQDEINKDLDKVQQILNDIRNNNYEYSREFELTYDGLINYFKRNKVTAIILFVIFIFIGAATVFDNFVKTKKNIEELTEGPNDSDILVEPQQEIPIPITDNIVENIKTVSVITDSLKLPYLKNEPLLDKGLYIRYNYNDLYFGGVNIDTISINARAKNGNELDIKRYSRKIEIDLTKEPYIEFNYKGINYSIEINGQHYSFYYTLRKDIDLTMKLIKYDKLK